MNYNLKYFLYIFIFIFIILLIIYLIMLWKANTVTFADINTDCKYRRYGCCPDNLTPKLDTFGSNCRGF
jgi:hypothetical protein